MHILGALLGFFLLSGGPVALPAYADMPTEPPLPHYSVVLTAYNAVPEQTDASPFETASGAFSNPEIIAARSQDLAKKLPFGTIIEIDGPSVANNSCGYDIVEPIIGYRIIADTMSVRYTNRIDILFSTKSNYTLSNGGRHNASTVLGICNGATVRVVGFIDLAKTKHIPKTQAALIAIVRGDNALALK